MLPSNTIVTLSIPLRFDQELIDTMNSDLKYVCASGNALLSMPITH